MAARGYGAPVTTLGCKECGASVHVGEGERTTTCAFCGSAQVLAAEAGEPPIRPESLLPFRVAKEDANKRFGEWLASRWLRPNDLKRIAAGSATAQRSGRSTVDVNEMGGVYVPFWTFNADVTSQWTADRGWYYYETESYTETINGQQVERTRQVQRTRWEPAYGMRRDRFDDVLVCAGRALATELVDKLSSFDTKLLVPYRPEFLAGWRAESYAVELAPASSIAQQKMTRVQEGRCGSDVGGNTHRNLSVMNDYENTTFKHVLLPVWVAAYRYKGKVYRFVVNGQTGEVVGVAPWSAWKIALLVVVLLLVIGGIIAVSNDREMTSRPNRPRRPQLCAPLRSQHRPLPLPPRPPQPRPRPTPHRPSTPALLTRRVLRPAARPLTMNPAVDLATLPGPAQKILDGSAPLPIRQMAAKGIAPGLRPVDALTVVALLAESPDAAVSTTAQATLGALPAPVIKGALGGEVPAGVLDVVAPRYAKNAGVMELILQQTALLPETVARCAEIANEAVSELLAVNEERLLKHPVIIEKLYMNAATRMSTADRMIELAVRNGLVLDGIPAFKEAAAAIADELIAEPTVEPTPDDILFKELDEQAETIQIDPTKEDVVSRMNEETGEEVVAEKVLPLHAKLARDVDLAADPARDARHGGRAATCSCATRTSSVAGAAIRSPKIQDNEIALISASRAVSDEVLRIIATNKSWVQDHQIKLNLVYNPRTPFVFSARLIGYLREGELKQLAKSKNVSAAIAQAARQQLNRRGGSRSECVGANGGSPAESRPAT